MSSSYEDVKKLYQMLDNDDVTGAKEVLKHLIKTHSVTREFIQKMLKTVAIEKMVEALADEVYKGIERNKSGSSQSNSPSGS